MTFRILSLDGGGVRGYLSALLLSNIEAYLNRSGNESVPIGDRFDLIAGTSTGGIIALGLARGMYASEIATFYETQSEAIFPDWEKKNWFARKFSPSYNPNRLRQVLEKVFPPTETLKSLRRDVSIVSVGLSNAKPRLHKTDFLLRNDARLDEPLIDVALATAAAPTYFSAHSSQKSTNLIDGGVCANNPSMVAVVDGMQFERPSKRGSEIPVTLSDISLLSIGTGEACAMSYDSEALANGGEIAWGKSFYEVSIESQSTLIHFQAKFLLRNYLRVNPQLKFAMALDDHRRIKELKNIADITRDVEVFLTNQFA